MGLFGKSHITTEGLDGDEMMSDDMGLDMEMDLTDDTVDSFDSAGSSSKKRKKKKGGFGKVLAVIVCLVLVWNLIGVITGPTGGQCRDKVEDFQYACNSLSANQLIDCMHPRIATPAKLVLMAAGAMTDTRPDDWLPDLVNLMGSGLGSVTNGTNMQLVDVFRQMKLTVKSVGFPGRTRKVRCKMTFAGFSQDINIYFKKSHGTTYIRKIRLAH